MAQTPQNVSDDAYARLRYLKALDIYKILRPYNTCFKLDKDFPTKNLVFEEGPIEKITDIRGHESEYTLEHNGFCMVKYEFAQSVLSTDTINKCGGYLDEVKELVFKTLGDNVERVEIIHWAFRNAEEQEFKTADSQAFGPDTYVHNDCNYYGGDKRIRAMLGAETDEILRTKRVRLINVWRPLKHYIEDCHLAILDGTTVDHEKCLMGDFLITPDYISQTNYARYSEKQKWYYMSNQKPNEVWLFKQHDTDVSAPGRYCPHTAFWRNDPMKCSLPRESIEVRALVITPK